MFNSNFCWSCLLVQVMKKRKKWERDWSYPFWGNFLDFRDFWRVGGSRTRVRVGVFFEISIWSFDLFFFMPDHVKEKKRENEIEKKWGAGVCGRYDFWKIGLIRYFFVYGAILANDGSKCLAGWVLPYCWKKNCNLGWKQPTSNLSNIM